MNLHLKNSSHSFMFIYFFIIALSGKLLPEKHLSFAHNHHNSKFSSEMWHAMVLDMFL